MAHKVATADRSMPRNEFDRVESRMAKASLPVNHSQTDGCALTQLVREGLVRACGSLKAASITMAIDQGQLTRDLFSGAFKFERLSKLSASEQAIVFDYIQKAVVPLATPLARLREIDRQEQALREERWQLIEGLAS